MIPKIIHFCWLSNDEYPELIKKCMATWKTKLPDYEFVLWDAKKFDLESTLWTKQAFETKKYAFASDYIRLYAVYTYGGIYLDTDAEVVKSFDDLLDLPYFIGQEHIGNIEAAVFGAEKGTDWLADCLKYYDNRPFIKEDGKLDLIILPKIMKAQIEPKRGVVAMSQNEIDKIHQLIKDDTKLFLYNYKYFSANNFETHEILKNKDTYAIHHYNNAWIPLKLRIKLNLKRKFQKFFGTKLTDTLIGYSGFRKVKHIFKSND
jgi:mannosyltransferase OCH1-like enzyme